MQASDLWYLAALLLVATFFMLYVRLGESTAMQFARAHFRTLKSQTGTAPLLDMGEEAFVRFYLYVRRRRDPVYLVLFVFVAIGATIFALMMAELARKIAYPGFLVWQFLTFFSVILSWAGAVIASLWAYQIRKTPALLWWQRRYKPQD